MLVINRDSLEVYREIMGEGYETFIKDLIMTFFDTAPKLISELMLSLESRDTGAFVRAAHSLKSNSLTMGAQSLADKASVLEERGRSGDLSATNDELAQLNVLFAEAKGELLTIDLLQK